MLRECYMGVALRCVALRCVAWCCVALCCAGAALRCVALCCAWWCVASVGEEKGKKDTEVMIPFELQVHIAERQQHGS